MATKQKRKWSAKVSTVSTYPPEGIFTNDAETIARRMASKKVSPKGIGSGIRMIQFFINRAGKDLPAGRRRELEKAKKILQAKLRKQRGRTPRRAAAARGSSSAAKKTRSRRKNKT